MAKKRIDLDIDKYQDMVKNYHEESDRAAAVLAGSFIEEFLRLFLREQLLDDPLVDEMLEGYGPLATFSARIDILYAMGNIDKAIRSDLNFIRKIRNHFAHHPEQTTFDESPVRDFCSNLSTAKIGVDQNGKQHVPPNDHRFHYLLAIGMIVGQIHNVMLKEKTRK